MASDVMGKNIKIGNASTETVLFTIEEMVQFVDRGTQYATWRKVMVERANYSPKACLFYFG